jgi:hypothetical protein
MPCSVPFTRCSFPADWHGVAGVVFRVHGQQLSGPLVPLGNLRRGGRLFQVNSRYRRAGDMRTSIAPDRSLRAIPRSRGTPCGNWADLIAEATARGLDCGETKQSATQIQAALLPSGRLACMRVAGGMAVLAGQAADVEQQPARRPVLSRPPVHCSTPLYSIPHTHTHDGAVRNSSPTRARHQRRRHHRGLSLAAVIACCMLSDWVLP